MKRVAIALLIVSALSACSRTAPPAVAEQSSAPVAASAPAYVEDPVDVAFDNAPKDGNDWTPPAGAWWVHSGDEKTCSPHKTGPGWVHEVRDEDHDSSLREVTQHSDDAGIVTSVDIVYSYRTTEAYTIYRSKSDCIASLPKPTQWFIADLNHAHCFDGGSPADKIREIQSDGVRAKTTDSGDKVEVAITEGDSERFWTYYRSESACNAALPGNQSIPSKYE